MVCIGLSLEENDYAPGCIRVASMFESISDISQVAYRKSILTEILHGIRLLSALIINA
jgi:hypothetical protein